MSPRLPPGLAARAALRRSRSLARSGMTLIEILVVIAIMSTVMAVGIPTLQGILDAQKTGAAKELALTYRYLMDEAALRNVSFRIAYNLEMATYRIEVGDPKTLIFSDPDTRQEFEEELQDEMKRYTQREIEEGAAAEVQEKMGRFQGLSDAALEETVTLPTGAHFAWVYTPQYEEPVRPSDELPEDPEDATVVYSYIFPDGTAEQTLVRIADLEDEDDGFTLEVEPLSGKVTLHDEELDWEDLLGWVPEAGPELDL